MFKYLRLFALGLFVYGVMQIYTTADYIRHAVEIDGTIAPSEPYRGPPRSPRSIPLTVRFKLSSSSEEFVTTVASPVFRRLEIGATLPLLVDPHHPQSPRINSMVEIWALPGGLVLGSVILIFFASAALTVGRRPT